MSLKLLTVSDIHGSKRSINRINASIHNYQPDAVVVCGDITHFGDMSEAVEILKHIDINEIIGIIGNCDPLEVKDSFEYVGANYIDVDNYDLNGYVFAGLSGSNHSTSKLAEFKEVASYADIFVLHSPPYGYLDKTSRGQHIGERGLLEIISNTDPKLILSGHAHESRGVIEEQDTVYLNPGPAYEDKLGIVSLGETVKAKII